MKRALLWFLLWSMLGFYFAIGALIIQKLQGDEPKGALTIIREKCQPCHSGEKPPNGLRVDSVDNMVRGGKSGPALVPFKPDESLMYKFMTPRDGAAAKMPPTLPKLSEDEIAIIRQWIERGAQQFSMSGKEP